MHRHAQLGRLCTAAISPHRPLAYSTWELRCRRPFSARKKPRAASRLARVSAWSRPADSWHTSRRTSSMTSCVAWVGSSSGAGRWRSSGAQLAAPHGPRRAHACSARSPAALTTCGASVCSCRCRRSTFALRPDTFVHQLLLLLQEVWGAGCSGLHTPASASAGGGVGGCGRQADCAHPQLSDHVRAALVCHLLPLQTSRGWLRGLQSACKAPAHLERPSVHLRHLLIALSNLLIALSKRRLQLGYQPVALRHLPLELCNPRPQPRGLVPRHVWQLMRGCHRRWWPVPLSCAQQ